LIIAEGWRVGGREEAVDQEGGADEKEDGDEVGEENAETGCA